MEVTVYSGSYINEEEDNRTTFIIYLRLLYSHRNYSTRLILKLPT